jgi:5'-nucleotidase
MVAATPAGAAPSAAADVVINEVYGGGGNSGATYRYDFIELVNTGDEPRSLNGWSVQYNSTTGKDAFQVTALSGVLPAGETLVVRQASGSNTSAQDVPSDIEGTISMSGTGGKVALVNTTTALSGCTNVCSDLPQVLDFVGWGSANDFAGSAAAPATSNSTSVARKGTQNTPDNALDFAAGAPTPEPCGAACEPEEPEGPQEKSIAEIQGTGSSSPLAGQEVTTKGVVTAAYPTGGFRGFFLQTEGTGGERDLSAASDGIFVFQPSGTLDADAVMGNFVEVTGRVSEYNGLTEITAAPADIVDADEPFDDVVPVSNPWPGSNAERESLEGMLYHPSGAFTVTNTYSTNQYGEVGLAVGDKPLIQPTELAAPGTEAADAIAADNAARAVTLDDGASTNFLASSFSAGFCSPRPVPCLTNGDLTPAYVSQDEPVRVGAPATFTDPVVVDYRFGWKLQPREQVVGPENEASPVEFTNTRTAAPNSDDVNHRGTADIRVASFNVLNYFTTVGTEDADCDPYTDRTGDGTNVRTGCDQRGAWDALDFQRQQEKIVSAINALDADVVGLMEIENSAALGESTDEALASLVTALNADAGAGTWAFVPSSTELPPASEQDVITNAMIYKPASVMRVDQSRALGDQSAEGQAFGNAREPIAQVFKQKYGKGEKFLVVVNHFKSKGSAGPWPGDKDTGDGQGSSVESRMRQAEALKEWVPTVLDETSTRAVVMVGDYNSYAMEDPMAVLYGAGYTNAGVQFDEDSYSYSYQGLSGSLDHVLVNDAALELVTGADHWNINAGESVALEYSRFDYHGTNFHRPGPYRSSDHDPVVLGLKAYAAK